MTTLLRNLELLSFRALQEKKLLQADRSLLKSRVPYSVFMTKMIETSFTEEIMPLQASKVLVKSEGPRLAPMTKKMNPVQKTAEKDSKTQKSYNMPFASA